MTAIQLCKQCNKALVKPVELTLCKHSLCYGCVRDLLWEAHGEPHLLQCPFCECKYYQKCHICDGDNKNSDEAVRLELSCFNDDEIVIGNETKREIEARSRRYEDIKSGALWMNKWQTKLFVGGPLLMFTIAALASKDNECFSRSIFAAVTGYFTA